MTMTVVEEKIIDTFLKDEELFNYVQRKVIKRLPAGPHLKSDSQWYKQVIDLTISEAFDDLQVVETLNYQILQLEKYLKKKSSEKNIITYHDNANINENGNEKNDINGNENMNPNYSFSEPIQQQPKQKRISKIKLLNHQNPNHQNGTYKPNEKIEKSNLNLNNRESQSVDRPVHTDENFPIDSSKNSKDCVDILNNSDSHSNGYNLVNPDNRITEYPADSLIETRTSTENDIPLMLESTDVGSPIVSPISGDSYMYIYMYICKYV
jgi:hypothetical protein